MIKKTLKCKHIQYVAMQILMKEVSRIKKTGITFQKTGSYFKMLGDAHFTNFVPEKGAKSKF